MNIIQKRYSHLKEVWFNEAIFRMGKVNIDNLKDVCIDILIHYGVSREDAVIIAKSIEYAHLRGKHTHGIGRMPIYVRKIKENLMNIKTPMNILREMGAVAIYDAQNGFGQVAAIKGAQLALDKAGQYGTGIVGICNSNNFGTAGFIGNYVTDKKMICMIFTNSGPAIAPSGGNIPFLGTNPICFSFPTDNEHPPIILDMACSNVARGKVRLAAKNGEKIPSDWALDENGNPTTDPVAALNGSMLALGGYKGYGLALCVDLLAGMMTGSGFAGNVKNLNHATDVSRCGHLIIVINPEAFMTKNEYEEKIRYFIKNLKSCGNQEDIYYPGEKSFYDAKKNQSFLEINDILLDELNTLAKTANIDKKIIYRN